MEKIYLSENWEMFGNGYKIIGDIPGSVYSFLMKEGILDDPYFRDNEQKFLKISEHEYTFTKKFNFEKNNNRVLLHCDGLDTLCEIYLNGKKIAYTDNMHREYEFDITECLQNGENQLDFKFLPVKPYIKERHEKEVLWDTKHVMQGIGHIRKNLCMMGWDWGPMLPDVGIWRDVYLLVENSARIGEFRITQRHTDGNVFVTPKIEVSKDCELKITLTTPDGNSFTMNNTQEFKVENPELWFPNGMGEHPLYEIKAEIIENGKVVDQSVKKIGLRTLELVREDDEFGQSFYHKINGVPFFAMGGDYIPEDNIMSRITYERSKKLLMHCKNSNFNTIRIWGGGFYPADWFFDLCDELGLVVFLDLMVACTLVPCNKEFLDNFSVEIEQNLKRIRHHACISVISGNNELEQTIFCVGTDKQREEYIYIFEKVVKEILDNVWPEIAYIPSSPTSGGGAIDPLNENIGDSHYWQVGLGELQYPEYRKHYFRYLSEFGFQSFPCEKTVNQFTLPEDRNICSRIMEMHQRAMFHNAKLVSHLGTIFRYPTDFGMILYASQILQADTIKYAVEHLRRNRGRCMGTLYWQINDIWPAVSWASIDCYGRFKALQYASKNFYSPILLSCEEIGETTNRRFVYMDRTVYDYETKAKLSLTNDTFDAVSGIIKWQLRNNDAKVLKEGEIDATIDAFSAKCFLELDFNKTDVDNNYISYQYEVNGQIVSEGTTLFTVPKYFNFKNPDLKYEINGNKITVFADAYAKSVEIYSPDSDFILSDNFFDMNSGSKCVEILEGTPKTIVLRSVYDIK